MGWIAIVMAILELVAKLPEIIAKLKEIFDRFRRVPALKVIHEARKLAKACEAKAEMHDAKAVGECPVDAFLEDLKARYP